MYLQLFLIILFLILAAYSLIVIYTIYLFKDCYDYELEKEQLKEDIKNSKTIAEKIILYLAGSVILTANKILEFKERF